MEPEELTSDIFTKYGRKGGPGYVRIESKGRGSVVRKEGGQVRGMVGDCAVFISRRGEDNLAQLVLVSEPPANVWNVVGRFLVRRELKDKVGFVVVVVVVAAIFTQVIFLFHKSPRNQCSLNRTVAVIVGVMKRKRPQWC